MIDTIINTIIMHLKRINENLKLKMMHLIMPIEKLLNIIGYFQIIYLCFSEFMKYFEKYYLLVPHNILIIERHSMLFESNIIFESN